MFRTIFALSFLPVLPAQANTEFETQTAWSNPGVYGPVSTWGSNYHFSGNLSTSSSLFLSFGSINSIDPELTNPDEVQVGDINGDGWTDAVGAGTGCLNWYESVDGTGNNWIKFTILQGTYEVHDIKIADINTDGFPDLVLCTSDDNVIWLENTYGAGLEWEEHFIVSVPNMGIVSAEVEDLNKDSYPDVIFATNYGGISWMENLDGTGLSWQEHPVQNSSAVDCDMLVIDLDLDGFADIISGYRTAFCVYCYRNLDSTGLNWEKVEIVDLYPPTSIHFGFVNEDEYPDIFAVSNTIYFPPGVSWFENPGAITPDWQEHVIKDDFNNGTLVHGTDLNGDGFSDVVTATASTVYYFINIAGGGAWQRHVLLGGCASGFIASGNMNSDDNTDIVFSNKTEDEMVWADINGYAQNGFLQSSVLQVAEPANWDSISWTANVPDSTSLGFQLRTSSNFPVMGLWTDTLYEPCSLEDLLEPEDNYIQYRAILSTSNSNVSPCLYDISMFWDPLESIEEAPCDISLLSLQPNPFNSRLTAEITLNESSEISLGIFDLSGRLMSMVANNTFNEGSYSLYWDVPAGLPNGCYIVRLETESGTICRNCVLVR